ncbi:MAG: hypothetical protein AAB657_04990 [Patescibacteria group bacterium]
MINIPIDPDFDNMSTTSSEEGSWWLQASPVLTFWFGVASGVAAISLLGLIFIIG